MSKTKGELRVVVIGGVAAGMSAASQAKRRRPDAEVIVLERGPFISYGACGMPYNIEDPSRSMQDLVVLSPERARGARGIDVRVNHEVLAILPEKEAVRYRDLERGEEAELSYDRLVIATGASAIRPPLPGIDLPGVHLLRTLEDGIAIKEAIDSGAVDRVAIIGAGYIGIEMAEGLRGRGVEVVMLEMQDQVAPGFSPKLAARAEEELRRRGVQLSLETRVEGIEGEPGHLVVKTSRGAYEAAMVLVAIGVRPNTALARDAGVALGKTGAIAVDAMQRTNLEHIFAAGDCAEALHRVSGESAYIPLGPTANKQGKIAGANAIGAKEQFAGIVGTAVFKVFDIELARAGLNLAESERLGLDAFEVITQHRTRGHGYPGGGDIHTALVVEHGTGRLLGAQIVADEGAAGRINVFATALSAKLTVAQIAALDLAYAPPFAPVYDPILIAATSALKELRRG